ncbi:MAG: helix-turn-helix domain-containing protein [Lamprobacter sp.]|uniref:helix-turn-helix domain-containing protein n=1 Tax=Lamprobacter sp. TaxID=3100796 RepID=UPI002B259014|nr:helix-turn-helix domain-containing protein [Lamprobacter sp.]MEA3641873.1 helix-turn-helix domain-containing protein [Lamprobacter sp.]
MTDYLSSEQAGELLGCSPSQISELVRARRLRAAKIGRGYRFRREWLDRFLEAEADRYDAELQAADAQPVQAKRGPRRELPDLVKYG